MDNKLTKNSLSELPELKSLESLYLGGNNIKKIKDLLPLQC